MNLFSVAARGLHAAGAGLAFCVLASCATADPAVSDAAADTALAAALAAVAAAPDAGERIRADIAYLADDARQGREAGTEGYDAAAAYVAQRFAGLGLEPGADGEWFQQVTLRSAARDPERAALILAQDGEGPAALVHLQDFIIGRSYRERAFNVTGRVVFAGYGVSAPDAGHDDYQGLDVEGKIVAVFTGAPSTLDSERRAHFSSNEVKQNAAAARGAVGFIALPTVQSERRYSWDRAVKWAGEGGMNWVRPDGAPGDDAGIDAAALMSAEGATRLFAGASRSFEELRSIEDAGKEPLVGFELPATLTIRGASIFSDAVSANVLGVIEGADPQLKDEVVVLTAHLDHEGVGEAETEGEDVIHNGAIDNAIGVATMIEAARAFKNASPPKRTIVFAALTAEEKGLLGAEYLARYPALDGKRVVANVNLDMPIALYPFTDVIAFGAERSTLGPLVEAATSSMGIKLSPDPIPEQGIFTRSDHYPFVKQGVPAVFLFLGFENGGEKVFTDFMKNHYHDPSDEIDLPIDYDAATRFSELNYRIARAISDAAETPRWREGDFFGETFGRDNP